MNYRTEIIMTESEQNKVNVPIERSRLCDSAFVKLCVSERTRTIVFFCFFDISNGKNNQFTIHRSP